MPRSRAAPAPASRASAAASRPRPAASSSSGSSYSSQSTSTGSTPQQGSSWFGSRPAAPPPAQHNSAPAPPPAMQSSGGGGLMSGLLGSVVQGAALGTGSAMAHRAVDSFMGPRETRVVHEHQGGEAAAPQAPMPPQAMDGPCADRVKQFADCMSRYSGDMGACQPYFDAMQQCKASFA